VNFTGGMARKKLSMPTFAKESRRFPTPEFFETALKT